MAVNNHFSAGDQIFRSVVKIPTGVDNGNRGTMNYLQIPAAGRQIIRVVVLVVTLNTLIAQGQLPPPQPEGPAQRTPRMKTVYDPRPLRPGLQLEDRGPRTYVEGRHLRRTSPYNGRQEQLVDDINDGFIFVKGAPFLMGGDADSLTAAPHRVRLNDYWVSPYEVYWKLWDDVFRWAVQHGYRFRSTGATMDGDVFEILDKPVARVSWYDAVVWLNAYSELRQLQPVYLVNSTVFRYVIRSAVEKHLLDNLYVRWSANGYRLPTEAEWEFAARGGVVGRATLYAGSNNPYDVAWFRLNADPAKIKPAGTLYSNGLGLYDMSGNLAEWCWDWFQRDYYYVSPAVDPIGPASGRRRVIRGGSWADQQQALLVTTRKSDYPEKLSLKVGFRPVRRAIYLPVTGDQLPDGVSPNNLTADGEATDGSDNSAAAPSANRSSDGYIFSLYSDKIIPYNEGEISR